MRVGRMAASLCALVLVAGCETTSPPVSSVSAAVRERTASGFVATGEELRSRTMSEAPEDLGQAAASAAFCAAAEEARSRGWSVFFVSVRDTTATADRANAQGDFRNLRATVILDVARDEGALPGASGYSVEAAFAEGGDCA